MEIQSKFDCILISWDIDIEKPNKEFYNKLSEELHEQPENILFVDDDKENIEAAKKLGFSVLHYYDHSKSLTQEVLNKLKQI
jgi:HAD superfamily hydrolase (TIGR01509 family)